MRIPPTSMIAASAASLATNPSPDRSNTTPAAPSVAQLGEVINATGEANADRDASGQFMGQAHDENHKEQEPEKPAENQSLETELLNEPPGHLDLWG